MSLCIVAVSYTHLDVYKRQIVGRAKFTEYFHRPENEWYMPIPDSELTVEKIEYHLKNYLPMTVLPSFGLSFYSKTPNTEATLELLLKRFNFQLDGANIMVFD